MDDVGPSAEIGLLVTEVWPGTEPFGMVLTLAARVLAQDRHLVSRFPAAGQSHVLGAFHDQRCVGFLRYLIMSRPSASTSRPGGRASEPHCKNKQPGSDCPPGAIR